MPLTLLFNTATSRTELHHLMQLQLPPHTKRLSSINKISGRQQQRQLLRLECIPVLTVTV